MPTCAIGKEIQLALIKRNLTETGQMVKTVFTILLLTSSFTAFTQTKQHWVDSVFQTLNTEEKIGQLFMLRVNTLDEENLNIGINQAKTYRVGGLIVSKGSYGSVNKATHQFQKTRSLPVLIGLDGSLDSIFSFPKPLLLSATNSDSLIYETARQTGSQLKSMGISLNFAPNALLADSISGDSLYSYWGTNADRVSHQLAVYVQGLKDVRVLACLKNLPVQKVQSIKPFGERTSTPSNTDRKTLLPFERLMHEGVGGILPSSIEIPLSFEREALIRKVKFLPTALSNVLTNTQVKRTFDYEGLLFANVPETKLTSGKIRWGEPELFAFQAGNDVLIDPQNIALAIRKIKKLVKREKIYAAQLDKSVRKILAAKFDAGLNRRDDVIAFDTYKATVLNRNVYRAAATVITDKQKQLPIQIIDNKRFASVSIGISADNTFNQYLANYTPVDEFCIPLPQDTVILKNLAAYETVIVGIFPFAASWQKELIAALTKLSTQTNLVLVHFGNPQLLTGFEGFETLIEAYTPEKSMTEVVAEIIFGALPGVGSLPLAVGNFQDGSGIQTTSLQRLGHAFAEEVEMDVQTLDKIKDIAYEAINAGATPGCHVLVARNGKIVYDRSFGWLTYENQIPVTRETIYDLASVTKVSATLQATAFLYEKGLIDINKKMSVYLPELKGSNKEDFLIKDILTHQAGLWPFLPFWAQTMKDSLYLPEFYSTTSSDNFPFSVSHNLFAVTAMKDSLWQWIIKSKIREKPARTPYDYRYSDMGFYMLQRLAEKMLNQPMEDFLAQNLYEPLGAYSMGYLPLQRFAPSRIAPTEKDHLFRKSLLVGYVHDQGAAMYGGVAGHAGLFGTANDLVKLGQLWLNEGSYAGLHYFKPETVHLFTTKQYEKSRRGLGWDKRDFINETLSSTSKYSSANTFGHTGFTGTCIWVDPDYDLVYVFLSNRVHPDMTNNKLLSMGIRTRIHDVLYESIFNYLKQKD
jgi:beta-N-acetylhexosaminidase